MLKTLREQVTALRAKVESSPVGSWRIVDCEHALMVSVSGRFGIELPLSAFRSAQGAASFLGTVLAAMP